jgi:hypothetical protein
MEVDIDRKLNKYLYTTDVINEVLDYRKPYSKQNQNYTIHWPLQLCYTVVKSGTLKQETQEE